MTDDVFLDPDPDKFNVEDGPWVAAPDGWPGKEAWGDGPWQDEPDELKWSFGDVACAIVRHPYHGSLNGYVGVPASHAWHGRSGDEIPADVHGGITFSGCFGDGTFATNSPTDVLFWWFGFDHGHFMDRMPGMDAGLKLIPDLPTRSDDLTENLHYWTFDEVKAEVETLARQAIDASKAP